MQGSAASYYPALTGFRVVAASMVFLAHHDHIISAQGSPVLAKMVDTFYISVSLFFVLSGFVITQQCNNRSFNTVADYLQYIGIRFARVFPMYWLILYGLYVRWLFYLPELFLHATLLKGYFSKYQLKGIVQSWTLTVELTFYLLVPFILRLIKIKSIYYAYGLTLMLGVLLALVGFYLTKIGYNEWGFIPDLKNMAWLTFFGRATEFFVGIYLYYYLKAEGAEKKHHFFPITYCGIFLLLIICFCLAALATPTKVAIHFWPGLLIHNLVLPFSIGMILYGLVREQTWLQSFLSHPVLIALGDSTYMFYLIHLGWIRNWFVISISDSVLLLFIFMWTLALVIHYGCEKPLYRWLKRKIAG